MLKYPQIDPVALHLGPLQIRWYGLTYLIGFALGWLLVLWRVKRYKLPWTKEEIGDLTFYLALGVILGGRLGYMLFYAFSEFIHNPFMLFKVWEGGMSFHGGLLGVVIAIVIFAKIKHKKILDIMDLVAPVTPLGLAAGRIGNFINAELWGRPTDVPWSMVFPTADPMPRHPSQLYEFALEGIVLFIILWWYAAKPRLRGQVSAMFLICYPIARIFCEFFREPDSQFGYLAFGWVTMGQLLSIPMFVAGLILFWWTKRDEKLPCTY